MTNDETKKKCEFCDSTIDPSNPFYEQRGLHISKRELEEIRRYLAYHLNNDGMWNNNDNPRGLINPEMITEVYQKLNNFLMK